MVPTKQIAGRYELVKPLNAGGMGQVWRGYDGVLDREVAVKLIRPDAVSTPAQAEEFAKRFRREARVTARIRHHGVPQVYDAVLDLPYDRLYLVMELVNGTSLRQFIDPQHPLPVTWAAAIAAQICTVLSHAHAVPVVHRDLKPDNILVTEAGAVKLLDFGIAAILRTDITRLTATGSPIGTSLYMSPEQVQSGHITPQSDLYALGCVLHELLCGRQVFDGDTEFQLMHQHVYGEPPPLRTLRPDLPEPLERLVLELLAKAPEQRPVDAYDVYQRLLPWLPPPGSRPPRAEAAPAGVPDPTLLYRWPNSPRPRPDVDTVPGPRTPDATPAEVPEQAHATAAKEAIRAAVAASDQLLDGERFTQAADVLQTVIDQTAAVFGAESPRLLRLRSRRAAILVVGGDFRRALPEFDALATAYARTAGPTSEDALECVRQAAHCRAALGETTVALRQFRQVLAHVADADGDAIPAALELRRHIGILLLSRGEVTEAVAELQPLYDDLRLVLGPDHDHTREVADVLARLNLARGRSQRPHR